MLKVLAQHCEFVMVASPCEETRNITVTTI